MGALLEKQFRRELQDSAGRMVSGIASSIKRRMGDGPEGGSPMHGVLSPGAARNMAVRDALAGNREVGRALGDMQSAEMDLSLEGPFAPQGIVPGLPPRLSAADGPSPTRRPSW